MSGRYCGELVSNDFGLAVAIRRQAYGRFLWEFFVLVGPTRLSIGFWRTRWGRG